MYQTIYQAALALACDRNFYDDPDLSVAEHLEEILEENFSELE